jgi:hypothetical protein
LVIFAHLGGGNADYRARLASRLHTSAVWVMRIK